MNILIHIKSGKSGRRVTSGKALVRVVAGKGLDDAIKRVALKRRGPLKNPAAAYWPADMTLLKISDSCYQCEWPGTESPNV